MTNEYYKIAISELLRCDYDVFLPVAPTSFKEVVVYDGVVLNRCIVRPAQVNEKGISVDLRVRYGRDAAFTTVDPDEYGAIIVCLAMTRAVWMLPIDTVAGKQRLVMHDRWLIDPLERSTATLGMKKQKELLERISGIDTELSTMEEAKKQASIIDDFTSHL